MSYPFSLKEVSKMFDIPITTLRYWERQGLIHLQRNDGNNYKEFFFDDLSYVCDMDIYHNLGWNKSELEDLYSMDFSQIEQTLRASDLRIQEEIEKLQAMRTRIEKRRAVLDRIQELAMRPYSESKLGMEKIVSTPNDKEALIKYGKPLLTEFVAMISLTGDQETLEYGFSVPKDFSYGKVLLQKGRTDASYVVFLLKAPAKELVFPYKIESLRPYIEPHVRNIARLYSKPKELLCHFLLTAYDEEFQGPCFYNEVYAQL
ncbi:MAG: MerR family DNA-binding transcriptional regulator [Clostridiales Family XIII bacterium]|nr:MerR family DNA-binding transcriptional regulator [Anaerovorax odorimutans]MCI7301865.1 MerR family DNA-binding transcriptional regulator [Clostridia bacterium]MDY3010832.1 MerR family DNA-binding transcriptional regulator [Clostridiales Family XIII bacterium]